jgi:hypothetical protein
MNEALATIIQLIQKGEVVISNHGYDELAADRLLIKEILLTVKDSVVIEEYPDYPKGPCILVLQHDQEAQPVHVVWGIPKGKKSPAVLVTAYRPDPQRWEEEYLKRRK